VSGEDGPLNSNKRTILHESSHLGNIDPPNDDILHSCNLPLLGTMLLMLMTRAA